MIVDGGGGDAVVAVVVIVAFDRERLLTLFSRFSYLHFILIAFLPFTYGDQSRPF